MSDVHYLANSDEWGTPDHVFALANNWYGPHLMDVAAQEHNTKLPRWSNDSLVIPWSDNNWCNPPFSLADEFVDKATLEMERGRSTTMILKAAIETGRFKQIRKARADITFLSPRVHYVGAGTSAPFPSCIVRFSGRRLDRLPMTRWYDLTKGEFY